jgi:hypothetical protein
MLWRCGEVCMNDTILISSACFYLSSACSNLTAFFFAELISFYLDLFGRSRNACRGFFFCCYFSGFRLHFQEWLISNIHGIAPAGPAKRDRSPCPCGLALWIYAGNAGKSAL